MIKEISVWIFVLREKKTAKSRHENGNELINKYENIVCHYWSTVVIRLIIGCLNDQSSKFTCVH